jgi:hypothetical protein
MPDLCGGNKSKLEAQLAADHPGQAKNATAKQHDAPGSGLE